MYLMIAFCSIPCICQEQLPGITTTKKKTEQTNNFLDMQANVYGDIFGNKMNVEEFKGIEGFMDMVNKLDASPEMKTKLTEQYQSYSKSLDNKEKELAKGKLDSLLNKAIKEGQEKNKQNH